MDKYFPKTEKDKWFLKSQSIMLFFTAAVYGIKRVDWNVSWKYICFLGLLQFIAYVDYKQYIIPNEFLLMALMIRGAFLIVEIFIMRWDAFARLLSELPGCIVILLFTLLVRIMTRKGLGMGDVKLFSIMPLFFGALASLEILMYSMLISFLLTCYLLITGKKGKKDVMPFAPSVFAGTFIYMIISII